MSFWDKKMQEGKDSRPALPALPPMPNPTPVGQRYNTPPTQPRTPVYTEETQCPECGSANYGGAVGWVDAAGDGTWAVAIRCAQLSADGRSARLVAGGGIVAESDPLSELAETQAKLQAMLSAIVRP